jgi:hypothetical protein
MEDHCRILNTGVPYSQYDPGYINEAVATPSEDTLLFNNSYIWYNSQWRDLWPDKSIGLVDEWRDGYFYTYSGNLNIFRSRNGTNWTMEDQVSFPVIHDGRNQNHVPVTQPANSAAYLYCKELKSGATDCIMSAAGYNTSGQPKRIIVKTETTHLANGSIAKITAFLCDEGNRRVLNTPKVLNFQLDEGDRGHLIGNTVIQTTGGTVVIYYQADHADDVVHINASAAGCRLGSVRITCNGEGHETGIDGDTIEIPANLFLSVDPASRTVGPESGTATFTISSNVDWSVSESSDWLTATKTNATTLTVSYNENTGTETRSATIILSGTGVSSQNVTVNQNGASPALILSVAPVFRSVGPDAGTTSFTVTANVDWSVSESSDWLTATKTNATTLTVNYDEKRVRSTFITITSVPVISQNVTVEQLVLP